MLKASAGPSESLEQRLAAQPRRSAQDVPTDTYSPQLAHEMVSFTKELLLTSMNALELVCDRGQRRQSLPSALPTCVHVNLPRGPRLLALSLLAGPLGRLSGERRLIFDPPKGLLHE